MIKKEPISIEHKALTDRFRDGAGLFNGDYCFGNLFAWGGVFDTQMRFFGNLYTASATLSGNRRLIGFPIGEGSAEEKRAFVLELAHEAREEGKTPIVGLVPDKLIEKAKTALEGVVTFSRLRDSDDYVYLTEKLIELGGDELHSKKNMLNSFLKNEYDFRDICPENLEKARAFCLDKCFTDNERLVTERFFDNFEALGLQGAVLEISGEIVAATLAERRGDTVIIHTEKAEKSVRGAYAAINNLFLKNRMADTVYVNREDDMGLENLRKAKLSYKPEFMVEKYLGTFNE